MLKLVENNIDLSKILSALDPFFCKSIVVVDEYLYTVQHCIIFEEMRCFVWCCDMIGQRYLMLIDPGGLYWQREWPPRFTVVGNAAMWR